MSDNYGSSPHLDRSFDFEVDRTGDLRADDGLRELEKDLAVQMAFTLDNYIGEVPSPSNEADVVQTAARLAEADTRVTSADRSRSSAEWSSDLQKLEVTLILTVNDEEQEMVFEV